jgi:biopolymer transport protein ExbB/TolQ
MNALSSLRRNLMRSPIIWGFLACAAFYGLIHGGPLGYPIIERYFTHHPVEYGETFLFAIGMAALVLRLGDTLLQRANLLRSPWSGIAKDEVPFDSLYATLRAALDSQSVQRQEEYYLGRLRAALQYVVRQGSPEGVNDELKYLAEVDATRSHSRFGLFRVIVWAIPILGFLGTVIGITLALNAIDPKNPDESMLKVITGLGLKFDTTAVALSLSMVLMFFHFFVDKAETALLAAVDRQVEDELAEFLPSAPAGADGQIVAVRRMAEVVVAATERLIERQAKLWEASMEAAAERWSGMADASVVVLARALEESMDRHAQRLAANEETVAEQGRRQWEKIAQGQLQHVETLATLQGAMAQQAESMQQIVDATHDVEKLEDALNRNLSALAGAKNFEQTVLGLAAAIHLLNARLAEPTAALATVQLDSKRRGAKAA